MIIARLQISLAIMAATILSGGVTFAQHQSKNPGFAFMTKYCLACHDADSPEGKLDLSRFSNVSTMLQARGVWAKVTRIVRNGEMPPREADQPTPAERESFVAAVQTMFRQADAAAPPDPGRVVVRRLNRTEYNNTIRDLCQIEFEPAENFPADDPSHGFDNQGEALSLSPLLMERYLDAAEAITTRALAPADPKNSTVRTGFAQFIVEGSRMPYRVSLFTSEPLTACFRLAADGDYVVRIEGKTIGMDKRSAEAALLVDGQQVERLAFVVPEKGSTAKFEFPLKLGKGLRRVSVRLLDPAPELDARKGAHPPRVDGKNDENYPGLELYRLDLVGPTDAVPESRRRILACDSRAEPSQQAREILERFARRAFRRPVESEEVARYVALFERSLATEGAFDAAIGVALQGILVSPHFLFRVELDDRPQAKAAHPINEFHLASRLSYFLWSSMPDEELLALAARGELSRTLDAQVTRLLADAKSDAFVENFAPQWLGIGELARVTRGPQLDIRLRDSLARETSLFFDDVLRKNRPITEFLEGRYTFLNERLARHYRLAQHGRSKRMRDKVPAHTFVRVELPGDEVRGGVLTHGSVLTITSAPDRTSPVKRGAWVLENILGAPPPPPPPNVSSLEQAKGDKAKEPATLRERLEVHRSRAECSACHARIDPFGFALERFDLLGQYRDKDGKVPIDDSAQLSDGKQFRGADGLRQILVGRKEQFARCLTEKMLTYALGRSIGDHDLSTVDAITAAVVKDDYRFQTLIREVVKSDPFRLRRGRKENP